MNSRHASLPWLLFGLIGLALLWIASLLRPEALRWIGPAFLASPLLAAALTLGAIRGINRITAACLAGLVILFALAWIV